MRGERGIDASVLYENDERASKDEVLLNPLPATVLGGLTVYKRVQSLPLSG